MPRICLAGFALLIFLFLGNGSGNYAGASATAAAGDEADTGTLQKMIVENGSVTMDVEKSATMPALNQPGVGTVPGPDVIVGDLNALVQSENGSIGGRVGLALGTEACNKGTIDVDWFALPSNDHPFIPQNVYRMSGGTDKHSAVRANRPILG